MIMEQIYKPCSKRYEGYMPYRNVGNNGLKLSAISLGLWHNFGDVNDREEARRMIFSAFDNGIIHFDLANNYGRPFGSAERNFGEILKNDLAAHRNELIISTKAGHQMWEGPNGDGGNRKYMIKSLDESLQRMNTDYVDVFYSHRYDPQTPIEETMSALSDAVRSGKAIYAGLSKYPDDKLAEAHTILRRNGTPCLIYQDRYSIFSRGVETTKLPMLADNGIGFIGFSPLAQGMLSTKYFDTIPDNSRAGQSFGFLQSETITPEIVERAKILNNIAVQRGQTLPQMALSWCLKDNRVTSVVIGTSSVLQLEENLKSLKNLSFSNDELRLIGEHSLY